MTFRLTAVATFCAWMACSTMALAQPAAHDHHHAAPTVAAAPAAKTAAPKAALDSHTQEDAQRHRGMAQAHGQAAQCLEAGQPHELCQKQLQAACKGLALGKFCGMRHAH